MNRRELLVVAGATVITAKTLAGCGPPKKDERYLALHLTGSKTEPPFRIEECGADGKAVGTLRGDDHKGIGLFLARTFKDAAAPKQLRMHVHDGATLNNLVALTKVCMEAGYERLKYYGCIPPGCGIPAGCDKDAVRNNGLEFAVKQLLEVATGNMYKC